MMRSIILDFSLHLSFDAIRGVDSVDVMDECVIFQSYYKRRNRKGIKISHAAFDIYCVA
jgi:hypothetical protein